MSKALLSVHVLAAIVFIGPVTVAAASFPRAARAVLTDRVGGDGVLRGLHRAIRGYTTLSLAVPVFGVATAGRMRVLGERWLTVAIVLTVAAGAVLALAVLPTQSQLLALTTRAAHRPDPGTVDRLLTRAAAASGGFALLWAVVTVLMIVRPGSTTRA